MPSLDEEIGFRFAATAVVVDSAVLEVAVQVHRPVAADRVLIAVPASSPEWHRVGNHRQQQLPDMHRSHPSMHYCCPVLGMSLASLTIPEREPKRSCSTFSWNRLRPGQ